MIKNIVELFYHLSEKHKLVRGFKYGRLSKDMGIGSEAHPFVFLEQPLYFGNTDTTTGTVPVTLNVDFLITPQMLENYDIYPSTEAGQNLMYHIGLNFIAKIREMIKDGDLEWISSIASWNWLTLYHFYDNDADGVRFTIVLNVRNQINFYDTDEHFNEEKEFDVKKYLPEIETDEAQGCVVFDNKLPKFSL